MVGLLALTQKPDRVLIEQVHSQYCSDKVQVGIRTEEKKKKIFWKKKKKVLVWRSERVPLPGWEGFRRGISRPRLFHHPWITASPLGVECVVLPNSVKSQLKKKPVREAERSERRAALDRNTRTLAGKAEGVNGET